MWFPAWFTSASSRTDSTRAHTYRLLLAENFAFLMGFLFVSLHHVLQSLLIGQVFLYLVVQHLWETTEVGTVCWVAMLSRDDAGALGENGRRREGSEKQWTGKALQIQGQREELGICFSARRSSRSQALTVKRQGNHGLELRTYVKISSQKRPKRYTQNGGGLQNERGKKISLQIL